MATILDYTLCQDNDCSKLTITDTSTFDPSADTFLNEVGSATITISGVSSSTIITQDLMADINNTGTGTITVASGAQDVYGVNTLFTTELNIGDYVYINGYYYTVGSIIDDVHFKISAGYDGTSTYNGIFYYWGASGTRDDLVYEITDTLADGLYEVEYQMMHGDKDDIYYITKTVLLYCSADCCVSKLLLEIPDLYACKSCKKERIQYILEIEGLRVSLQNAVAMGKYDAAEDILDLLTTICSTQNCNCNDY